MTIKLEDYPLSSFRVVEEHTVSYTLLAENSRQAIDRALGRVGLSTVMEKARIDIVNVEVRQYPPEDQEIMVEELKGLGTGFSFEHPLCYSYYSASTNREPFNVQISYRISAPILDSIPAVPVAADSSSTDVEAVESTPAEVA